MATKSQRHTPTPEKTVTKNKVFVQTLYTSHPSVPISERLSFFRNRWEQLVSDSFALSVVRDGFSLLPYLQQAHLLPRGQTGEYKLSKSERAAMRHEVERYQALGAFKKLEKFPRNAVFSKIFPVIKKNGKTRLVIDLRNVNKHVRCQHFQMERLKDAKVMITKGCFLASIDLQDAYLHIPIADDGSRDFLNFMFEGSAYQVLALPFGLNLAPRVFTKILRCVMAQLRLLGVKILIYIDDALVMGETISRARWAVQLTLKMLTDLGFLINWEKSEISPSQIIEWLGVDIDSQAMVFRLPKKRMTATKRFCRILRNRALSNKHVTLRELASVVGKITSCGDSIENCRIKSNAIRRDLQLAQRDGWKPNRKWFLSDIAQQELKMWADLLHMWNGKIILQHAPPDRVMATDASTSGWGAVILTSPLVAEQGAKTMGFFNSKNHFLERKLLEVDLFLPSDEHISYLELVAAVLGLRSFAHAYDWKDMHILIKIDNVVALSYLNRMGGRVWPMVQLVTSLGKWAEKRHLKIRAEYLDTTSNWQADALSRAPRDSTDWMLSPAIFQKIEQMYGPHTIDLFATYQNTQLESYSSRYPDPGAVMIDSLSPANNWADFKNPYANPPFAIILQVLGKLRSHVKQITVTMIAPVWPSRPWFPELVSLLVDVPMLLPMHSDLFTHSFAGAPATQAPAWPVAVWRLSNSHAKISAFRRRLSSYFVVPSRYALLTDMRRLLGSGADFAKTKNAAFSILSSLESLTL